VSRPAPAPAPAPGPAITLCCEIDHLVIAAASLAQGAAWCEAVLGVLPGPGGQHPLMGTHNRLLRIDSPAFPLAYLEILAIDTAAPLPGRARWFGLDDPALQAALRVSPRLVGVVARTTDLDGLRQALLGLGIDPGPALAAERDTPQGKLAWRIAVRDDGALPGSGRLPTLIQWQGRHPAEAMAPSPVALGTVVLGRLAPAEALLLGLPGPGAAAGSSGAPASSAAVPQPRPALSVTLATPRGLVTLSTAA